VGHGDAGGRGGGRPAGQGGGGGVGGGRAGGDVDPVVTEIVGVAGDPPAGGIQVQAVAARDPIGQGMEDAVVRPRRGEVAAVDGVMAVGREVGGDVGGVGVDSDRAGEADLLPAGGGFVGEGSGGKQVASG